eukprot:COSAG02_NODE_53537_length_301_cov_0.757426_1_plen_37_part_01
MTGRQDQQPPVSVTVIPDVIPAWRMPHAVDPFSGPGP